MDALMHTCKTISNFNGGFKVPPSRLGSHFLHVHLVRKIIAEGILSPIMIMPDVMLGIS